MSLSEDMAHFYLTFCEFCAITGTCYLFHRANELIDEDDEAIPDIIGECERVKECMSILEEH